MGADLIEQQLELAAVLLRKAKYAVALTGAGISTASGIPDFRSKNSGIWNEADPFEVASIFGFRQDAKPFFEWMRPLARLILDAEPNPAHKALARLDQLGYIQATITQNIDGLHTRAGSSTIHEVHGHMREATCVECFRVYPVDDDLIDRYINQGVIPHCPHCGGILKPNVILMGEQLPVRVLQKAERAARSCDVMLITGTSLVVAPVSELPLVAHAYGAEIIVINREKTYIDKDASVVIHDDIARVLPRLVRLLDNSGELSDYASTSTD